MLDIYTKYGCFGHFKDLFLFMQEQHLQEIEITKLRYCLDEIFGKGIYKLKEIEQILEG